jgi:signal peptidase I
MQWFMDNDNMFKTSKAYGGSYIPKKGDVIFFSDKFTLSDSTHVGIVTNTDASYIYTIEGNSGDMVREKKYALNSKYILGYGVIPYTGEKKPTSPITPATDKFNYIAWVKKLQKLLGVKVTGKADKTLLAKTPTLKYGSDGEAVSLLQEFLVAQGYNLGNSGINKDGVDGDFKEKTKGEVIKFQKDIVKLSKPDGILDTAHATWKKILQL